jgi:phenylpropionate dioxygenase-like ring-hydroxylating dioxygenase large terminal subunit
VQGLPFSLYLDPARAPHEAQTVFAASWQFVCHASDLPAPGTAARFDCAGRSAVVLRTRAGGLQAYRNACRHRGARLVEGDAHTGLAFCVDGRLRCPYHGWTYDEAGALVAIPDQQRFDATFDPSRHALHPIHVAQWRGLVFVAFEQPREALADALHGVFPDWPDFASLRRVIEPRTVACPADWKLAVEHLLDTAHIGVPRPGPRPRLFDPPKFEPCTEAALAARAAIGADAAGAPWSARAYRGLLRRMQPAADQAGYIFLWPNTLLQFAFDGIAVLQVLPGTTGVCSYRESRYAQPDVSREMRLLRYLHQRVRRQSLRADALLLARVQQGLASALEPGPIATGEAGLRWFASRYCERAVAPARPAKPVAARRRSRLKAVVAPIDA